MALHLNDSEIRTLIVEGVNVESVAFDGVVVAQTPVIVTQPVGGAISDSQSLTLSVTADGLGSTLTYQWYQDGAPVADAKAADFTFVPTSPGTVEFYCVVTGFGGSVQTHTVSVEVSASAIAHTITIGTGYWVGTSSATFKGYAGAAMVGALPTYPAAATGSAVPTESCGGTQLIGANTTLASSRVTTGGLSIYLQHDGTGIEGTLTLNYDTLTLNAARTNAETATIQSYWFNSNTLSGAFNVADGEAVTFTLSLESEE